MVNLSELNEKALETLTKGFNDLTTTMQGPIKSFTETIAEGLVTFVEEHLAYNISAIVRDQIETYFLAILAGDMQVLRDTSVLSEYCRFRIHDVRKKIWQECATEIEKSLIKELQDENKELQKRLDYYIKRDSYY